MTASSGFHRAALLEDTHNGRDAAVDQNEFGFTSLLIQRPSAALGLRTELVSPMKKKRQPASSMRQKH